MREDKARAYVQLINMEIHFPKKPNLDRLCLMAAQPTPPIFLQPFILNSTNISSFIYQHEFFGGKYVFDKLTGQLGCSPGDKVEHRPLKSRLFGNPLNKEVFGAYLSYKRTAAILEFTLHGASGHFGKPTAEEDQLVAEHIARLLGSFGLNPSIKATGYSTVISASLTP